MISKPKNLNSKIQFGYIYLFKGYYINTDPIGWLLGLMNRLTYSHFIYQQNKANNLGLRWNWYEPASRAHSFFEACVGIWRKWDRFYRYKLQIQYFFYKFERIRHEQPANR